MSVASASAASLKEELDDEFTPLSVMPTSRLNDIMKVLETKQPAVLNIDALLPAKEAGDLVLKSILHKMPRSVKTFSLRFNHLSAHSIEELTSWISTNDHLEVLYVMGSGIDEKSRLHLEHAWKKHLVNHRYDISYSFESICKILKLILYVGQIISVIRSLE